METTIKISGAAEHLSQATGYSTDYCQKVIQGRRSATSKGGKIITEKHQELIKILDHFYTANVCVAETEEEMNELLTQKIQ